MTKLSGWGSGRIIYRTIRTLLSLVENLAHRTGWVRHSRSRKSSATYSYHQSMQYFRESKQRYDCQCLGFLTCAQMLMYAIGRGWSNNNNNKTKTRLQGITEAYFDLCVEQNVFSEGYVLVVPLILSKY